MAFKNCTRVIDNIQGCWGNPDDENRRKPRPDYPDRPDYPRPDYPNTPVAYVTTQEKIFFNAQNDPFPDTHVSQQKTSDIKTAVLV